MTYTKEQLQGKTINAFRVDGEGVPIDDTPLEKIKLDDFEITDSGFSPCTFVMQAGIEYEVYGVEKIREWHELSQKEKDEIIGRMGKSISKIKASKAN